MSFNIRKTTQDTINDIINNISQSVIPMVKRSGNFPEAGFLLVEEIYSTGKYKLYLENIYNVIYSIELVKIPINNIEFKTIEDIMDAGWEID
jgi:hypothetical protein